MNNVMSYGVTMLNTLIFTHSYSLLFQNYIQVSL